MYVPKSPILLAVTGIWKISSVACGFSYIKIDYSDYPKSLISRINEVYGFFSMKYRYCDRSMGFFFQYFIEKKPNNFI